ncbi:MAG: hypothetical protein M3332_04590 [Actinomycetota bacterium]|jgi:hypothetical protein|nr:hypothetical protein [Actinomycetota bacterium]
MRRLLGLVAVALLCAIGAGLLSAAALASNAYQPIAVQHITGTRLGPSMTMAITPVPSPPDQASAAAKVTQAVHEVLPNAQVGFTVFDRQNNTVLISHDADRQFASMSLVKLLIALDELASDNWTVPEEATRQELHQMLADSNDGIASNWWAANGGPAIVIRMVGLLGLTGTEPPENSGRWGNTLTTPQDVVTVYRYITDQVPSPSRDVLLSALADAQRIAEDGFDQYFGIPVAMPGTPWAIKQGWGTSGSQAVMLSTGLVGPGLRYVVVVLASAPTRSYSTIPAAITAGTDALAEVIDPAIYRLGVNGSVPNASETVPSPP